MTIRNKDTIDKQIKISVDSAVAQAINRKVDIKFIEKQKDLLVKRTQLGIGVNLVTGNAEPLDPLSENYKQQRRGEARWYTDKSGKRVKITANQDEGGNFVKKPRLSGNTKPSKSNLTATGQLLKSLSTVKIRKPGAIIYKIIVGDRRGRGLFGYPSNVGNKELVRILARKGRTFLGFTNSQRNQIQREIRRIIINFLR